MKCNRNTQANKPYKPEVNKNQNSLDKLFLEQIDFSHIPYNVYEYLVHNLPSLYLRIKIHNQTLQWYNRFHPFRLQVEAIGPIGRKLRPQERGR